MQYPGRVIKKGESDPAVMQVLKRKLNEALGLADDPAARLDVVNPVFDTATLRAVKLFQARNVDTYGRTLKQDGQIGSLTWAALFGPDTVVRSSDAGSPFLRAVLQIAAGELAKGVREQPKNSNRGAEVEAYLASTGLGPGHAWCCAFTYWCFEQAARQENRGNPTVRTAGCLHHWNKASAAGAWRIPKTEAIANPGLIVPGMVFIMDHGGGKGHTGFVESVAGGLFTTIEGNTDASRTREGGGVYRLERKVTEINKGFIDYSHN